MSATWTVIVGNMGTCYRGADLAQACTDVAFYVTASRNGYGRAAGEQVTLLKDGVVVLEHNPPEDL